jgi:RNA polymerase sigma-70 factor (ECF subfamily)
MSSTTLCPQSDVASLVSAAQQDDRQAFGQLYLMFQGQILAYCRRRTSNEAEAQELCQDVFLQAMRKIRSLRSPAAISGWLRTIAARLSVNRVARRRPMATSNNEVLDIAGPDHVSPLDNIMAIESQAQVRAGLERLKDLDRRTLEAFYVHGQSLIEMSAAFQAPVGTIKRRLFDARQRLAAAVEVANAFGPGSDTVGPRPFFVPTSCRSAPGEEATVAGRSAPVSRPALSRCRDGPPERTATVPSRRPPPPRCRCCPDQTSQ